jgi:hypothetical protein
MADDYRVEVGFWDHPKTVKVMRDCGGWEGGVCIQRLFEFCAKNLGRSTGDLTGMEDDDIEIAVKWSGAPGVWIASVRLRGFFDEGTNQIHEFEEHQPWIAGTAGRSESGRVASAVRWHKEGKHAAPKKGCPLCERNADASKTDAARIDPQCPDIWKSGAPITSVDDFKRAIKLWGWKLGPKLGQLNGTVERVIAAGAIEKYEVTDAKKATDTADGVADQPRFFLGCVERARREAELAAAKPSPPPRPGVKAPEPTLPSWSDEEREPFAEPEKGTLPWNDEELIKRLGLDGEPND